MKRLKSSSAAESRRARSSARAAASSAAASPAIALTSRGRARRDVTGTPAEEPRGPVRGVRRERLGAGDAHKTQKCGRVLCDNPRDQGLSAPLLHSRQTPHLQHKLQNWGRSTGTTWTGGARPEESKMIREPLSSGDGLGELGLVGLFSLERVLWRP